jgi:hypothetical protein
MESNNIRDYYEDLEVSNKEQYRRIFEQAFERYFYPTYHRCEWYEGPPTTCEGQPVKLKHPPTSLQKRGMDCVISGKAELFIRREYDNPKGVVSLNGNPLPPKGETGRRYLVETKTQRTLPDALILEQWSVVKKDQEGNIVCRIPGWTWDRQQDSDLVAILKVQTGCVYMLPMLALRRAWYRNYETWVQKYKPIVWGTIKDYGTYESVAYAIPIKVVQQALGETIAV